MSYHENANHGKPSSAPPKKRSKQLMVTLTGGPRDGDNVLYGQPLPRVLVLHSQKGWTDYYRKPNTTTYISADEIPPEWTQT